MMGLTGARHIDHVTAVEIVSEWCDVAASVVAVDSVGGVWKTMIGLARVPDGDDAVIAVCPSRGWAMWCRVYDGVEVVMETIRSTEPMRFGEWHD
jgi:hypothetical protein